MTRITIDRLSKRFEQQQVLDDLSLDIEDGHFFTLLGPSGCGKTTLLRCLAGFARPEAGRILFDGEDITAVPAYERNIGMVFQDYALFPDKSVFDNVAYGLRARKLAREGVRSRTDEALAQVDLATLGSRFPAQLSGGQRQRVALARALVIKPRLLLMDEPLSNLDAKLRLAMREAILDLQRATRITTVFVTHDQEEALALSDRIAVMQGGRLAQQGAPRELWDAPVTAYVADFIGSANLLKVRVLAPGRVAVDAAGAVVAGAGAAVHGADTGALPAGAAGLWVLRPEALQLAGASGGEGSDAAGRLPATVARRQYLGARTSYRVTLAGGQALRLEQPGPPAFEVGAAVAVLVPRDGRVVAG